MSEQSFDKYPDSKPGDLTEATKTLTAEEQEIEDERKLPTLPPSRRQPTSMTMTVSAKTPPTQ